MTTMRIGALNNQLSNVGAGQVIGGIEKEGLLCKQITVTNLEYALTEKKIDAAVYNMKDLPLSLPENIVISAVLKRDPPFDFLVVDKPLEEVYNIGTSSLRRRAQLLRYYHKYPEMHISPIDGDIEARLLKLQNGEYDAIILAEAALKRLGYMVNGFRLPADAFVPSPNQGAIAVVSSKENMDIFAPLNHESSNYDTSVERVILGELGDTSFIPVGVYAQGGQVLAEVLSLDGARAVRVESEVPCLEAAQAIGHALKEKADFLLTLEE